MKSIFKLGISESQNLALQRLKARRRKNGTGTNRKKKIYEKKINKLLKKTTITPKKNKFKNGTQHVLYVLKS